MRGLLRKPKFWLGGFALAVLAFILLGPVQTMMNLVAVQDAVRRDWEISFGYSTGSDKPALLPLWLDTAALHFFERKFDHTRGYSGREPAKTRNRDIVYHERFRALFRGPIEDITVYDFDEFYGDLGAALERFPDLRRVIVYSTDSETRPTEAEWKLLCTHLRALPHLEELEIGGQQVTDRAIAPLAGHPKLRKLSISDGRLTESSTKTFVSLPRLVALVLSYLSDSDESFSPEIRARMSVALPAVKIDF